MITKDEIDAKSGELGVHQANVQRDYVFSWLLYGLYDQSNPLANDLILKGGNALRKCYFENARYSPDLDLSTQTSLSEDQIKSALQNSCAFASERSGIEFKIEETRVRSRSVDKESGDLFEARVYFRSFYGEEDFVLKVDLDVKEFDRIYLPVQSRNLIHSYSDSDLCNATIRCLKLEEMLAAKLKVLLQRQHSPDLFDFVYSLFFQKTLDVSRIEVITAFLKKSIYERNPFTARDLLLGLPFAIIQGLWDKFLVCPRTSIISFEQAVGAFRTLIGDLFALIPSAPLPATSGGVSFGGSFRSSTRQTIFEAATLLQLLSIEYDGYQRVVEPYALTFKRRKDGQGAEYFYAWDRSGGRSRSTGIKSFFADKVVNARVLEESFEPRYPIELNKSSGYFSSGSFAAQSRPRSTPSALSPRRSKGSRSPALSFGMTYTVECPYCGKRFKRSSFDTKLNKHKDKYGNPCVGRIGYIV